MKHRKTRENTLEKKNAFETLRFAEPSCALCTSSFCKSEIRHQKSDFSSRQRSLPRVQHSPGGTGTRIQCFPWLAAHSSFEIISSVHTTFTLVHVISRYFLWGEGGIPPQRSALSVQSAVHSPPVVFSNLNAQRPSGRDTRRHTETHVAHAKNTRQTHGKNTRNTPQNHGNNTETHAIFFLTQLSTIRFQVSPVPMISNHGKKVGKDRRFLYF
jgi:hypothetical protein